MNVSFDEIAQAINEANRVAILSHIRPDGDAIGAQLALALSLQHLGKSVVAWNEQGLPESFRFLKASNLITTPPSEPQDFDVAIALDTASQQRLGTALGAIRHADIWINIDHHISNPGYGDLVYIDPASPATGQIIYEFLRSENLPLTYAAADALYVAISTDTGSFRFPNTTARTFEVAADFGRLPREVELAMFRVLQESLTNVHRHSGSLIAHVRLLASEGMATLEVADEGKGVPPGILKETSHDWTRALGVGLRGMNERMRQLGGTLLLMSSERGTTVSASVPTRK